MSSTITSLLLCVVLVVAGGSGGALAGPRRAGRAARETQTAEWVADDNGETHDFSEGFEESGESHHESLGFYADHLDESSFPADYKGEQAGGEEYADGIATEHRLHIEEAHHLPEHFDNNELGQEHIASFRGFDDKLDEFESKPVPGIDHGKGAFSYSTSYEFK